MIFTLTGPIGSGKTGIFHYLLKYHPEDFRGIITATTRKPRPHEKNGKEYFFELYPEDGFDEWRGLHIAPVIFGGNFYGIPIHQAAPLLFDSSHHYVVVVEWQGALDLKKILPNVRNIYIKVQRKKLRNRLSRRKQDGKERLVIDKGARISSSDIIPYDFILRNNKKFRYVIDSLISYIEQETGTKIKSKKNGGSQ